MLKKLFDVEADETVSDFQLSIQHDWIITLLLLAALFAYTIYLYRSESWLSKNRRLVMGGCYLLAGLLLILILLEPAVNMESTRPQRRNLLVLLDASQSMAIADQRQHPAEIIEAGKILQKIPLDQTNEPKDMGSLQKDLAEISRMDLAKAATKAP